eukprot:gene35230-39850_t
MLSINVCLLVAGLVCVAYTSGDVVRTTVDQAPVLANSDQVQFFILESSFPFNAPAGLKTTAGDLFQKFYVTHAGLGVWDINTGEKFSIEFISKDYLGALLPAVNTTTNELTWQNAGGIVVTIPTNFDDWLDRRRQLVLMAFEILDSDHSGVVELNDISAKYNADKHPDVLAGRRSKDDVLREFLDTFDTIDKD